MTSATPSELPDIRDRDDLSVLVHAFYDRIREEPQLGPIFDKIAEVDWQTHLPKMVGFWEKALFRSGEYNGNPLRTHLNLNTRVALDRPLFERWIQLFDSTVDEHFQGDRAGHIKRIGADMAQVMYSRISGEAIPFSSPDLQTKNQSESEAASE
jgi:hemoglobin